MHGERVGEAGEFEGVQVGEVARLAGQSDAVALHQVRVVLTEQLPDQISGHDGKRERAGNGDEKERESRTGRRQVR